MTRLEGISCFALVYLVCVVLKSRLLSAQLHCAEVLWFENLSDSFVYEKTLFWDQAA